jgi:hypothetical protein
MEPGAQTARILYRLETASAPERALILAALSIVSAILSWRLPTPDLLFIYHTPLPPAFWFGLVLCAGVALWASRRPFDLFVVLLASFIAWHVAVETTSFIHDNIAQQINSPAPANTNAPIFSAPPVNYLWGLCGMVGGLIGSSIVVCAIAAVIKGFRTSNCWARTILFGTIAGFLLEFAEDQAEGGLFIHVGSLLPLFLLWQMSVAGSIAYDLKPQIAYKPLQDS